MKLLADEDFPPTLVSFFQKKHHNVKRIQRSTRGVSDTSVEEKAIRENRIIVTFDKDFLKKRLKQDIFSVIVFDFPYLKPTTILPYMNNAVESIIKLKRRKKYFTARYSSAGLELF